MKEANTTEDAPIECKVCLKHIPRSEAKVEEASDYVMYFCGLDCFEKWRESEEFDNGY